MQRDIARKPVKDLEYNVILVLFLQEGNTKMGLNISEIWGRKYPERNLGLGESSHHDAEEGGRKKGQVEVLFWNASLINL